MSKFNQGFLVLYDDKSCQRARKNVGCFSAFFFSFGIPNFVQALKSERKEKLTGSPAHPKVSREGENVADVLFLQPTC
jgi:hypothetical protein